MILCQEQTLEHCSSLQLESVCMLLLSAKLTGQKADAGISCILNHFRIDVSGFFSASKHLQD